MLSKFAGISFKRDNQNVMNLNPIKKEILIRFIKSPEGLRYRDAKKFEWENDLYNYHLQSLVKENLIEKTGYKYFLTNKGKKFVEVEFPLDPIGINADLFRINVLCIVVKTLENKTFQVLNQKRKRTPYAGDIGIIGGAVLQGELIVDAAKRKLMLETGLEADFKHISTVRKLRYSSNQELFSDIEFHICLSLNPSGNLVEDNAYGFNYFVDIDKGIENELSSIMGSKSVAEILKQLKVVNFTSIPFQFFEEKKIIENFN